MAETDEQLVKNDPSWDGRTLVIVVFATVLAEFSRDISWLPFPVGLLLAYFVVMLVGYWFGRRSHLRFGPFALMSAGYLLFMIAGLWAVPKLLSKLIWAPLAVGGSLLVFGILFYWLPPLYPSQGRRQKLWVWVIWILSFAVLFGYLATKPDYFE